MQIQENNTEEDKLDPALKLKSVPMSSLTLNQPMQEIEEGSAEAEDDNNQQKSDKDLDQKKTTDKQVSLVEKCYDKTGKTPKGQSVTFRDLTKQEAQKQNPLIKAQGSFGATSMATSYVSAPDDPSDKDAAEDQSPQSSQKDQLKTPKNKPNLLKS